jgi:hypothetical protein
VAAPVPPDARAAKVVETIYRLFLARGSWPSFTELDRYLDMRGEPDAESVLVGLPTGIAYGVGMPPFRDDQEIALTVAGLAACPSAVEDLEIFLRVVRHAAELEQEQLPGEPKPEVTSASIVDRIELPAAGRADLVRRVGAVLRVEQWGWASAAQNDEGWSFTIDRRVRRLRGVASIADYWARTREEVAAAAAPAAPLEDQALRVRAWLELHHTIPKVVIVNASEAEIRNVVPSMSLQAVDEGGEPTAMVGGGPVGRVAEISPGAAFVGELVHLTNWSKSTQVESTLHLQFDDVRGQRWQLAHGSVIAIDQQERGPVRAATGELVDAQTLDLSEPISGFVTSDSGRVAFISYVHEDRATVDALQRALEGAGITVWRDLDRLLPGESKRQKILDAIRHQSFAFLSCFSAARADRERTYANEELSIALDVLRTQNSAAWFIPVRLDDGPMPSLALGHHGTLEDIIWVNLFGAGRDDELTRLIAALQRLV